MAAATAPSPIPSSKACRAPPMTTRTSPSTSPKSSSTCAPRSPTQTSNKQHPRDFGNMDNSTPLADLKKPGITLARYPVMYDSRTGEPLLLASAQQTPLSSDAARDVAAFQDAIRAGRLLPTKPTAPSPRSTNYRGELTPEQYFAQENQLRIALENQAQQVLLKYLTGDQQPQSQQDFDAGSQYMEAATRLTPESLYLEGRKDFFRGPRAALRQELSRRRRTARAIRAYRSRRGLWLQRSRHLLPGAGRFPQGDPGFPRRYPPRAPLVLPAAQSRAGLRRERRLS